MEGLELRVALREAEDLRGSRVAKVHQVGEVLFLRLFSPRGSLVIDPLEKAFHRTELRPPAPEHPPAFAALLRKHLRGKPLLSLEQAGYDRILRLRFPDADLVVDFRPRRGNVLLVVEDRIIGALAEPRSSPADWGGPGDPVEGVGPGIRRALGARLGRAPTADELRRFAAELISLAPQGFLYRTPRGPVASFFPRPELGEAEEFPCYFMALDRVREEALFLGEARELLRATREALRRKRRALEKVHEELERAQGWEELQRTADLILTRLSEIPRGAKEVRVEGFDGTPVILRLDPSVPPQEYAQRLYARARKLRRALEELPLRAERLRAEVEELRALLAELERKPYLAPYLEADLEVLGARVPRPEHARKGGTARARTFHIRGFRVLVGRSARENERLVREAHPRDIWLHARGVPGAHVIVKSAGQDVPREVLEEAARLAAWHSKARYDTKVAVTYTEVRYLRKPKGAPPGAFAVTQEKVLVVRPEGEENGQSD
ncbi:Rqc2 family fibronectin-binding protein [Candidatus Bipolaricaulota sp. J31]